MIVLRDAPSMSKITLVAMSPDVATELGRGFAAIDPWARYKISAATLTAYFLATEPGTEHYVVRVNDALAGAVSIRSAWLRGPYLKFLGVLPAYQSQGAGQLILAWFEGIARARGNRNLWVAASDFNAPALKFYERHGFQRAARLDSLIEDGETEILMRKRLFLKK